jgi:hypothetical protein
VTGSSRAGAAGASPADALSFTEVRGQLQAVVVHSRPAIRWPSMAAATPSTMLTTMLASAGRT